MDSVDHDQTARSVQSDLDLNCPQTLLESSIVGKDLIQHLMCLFQAAGNSVHISRSVNPYTLYLLLGFIFCERFRLRPGFSSVFLLQCPLCGFCRDIDSDPCQIVMILYFIHKCKLQRLDLRVSIHPKKLKTLVTIVPIYSLTISSLRKLR